MITTVINLLGGPGCGKSTTAAGLYAEMKRRGMSVELVREYVKNWAWEGREVGMFDQLYLFGKQARAEYTLYGKVDYIVTDSPVILCPIYERFYRKPEIVGAAAVRFLDAANDTDMARHRYFVLRREKPYDQAGRYQNEIEARHLDEVITERLEFLGIPYDVISGPEEDRPKLIFGLMHHDTYRRN